MTDTTATVYYISPEGNEQADGSAAAPLRTLGEALKRVAHAPGPAEIVLLPGVYPPLSLRGAQGTPERPVVIRGLQPVLIDYSVPAQLDRRMEWQAARLALDSGAWQLPDANGLAVIAGGADGSEICGCANLRLEHLVFYNGRNVLAVRRCREVTIADCVVTGEPAQSVNGVAFRVGGPDDEPSRRVTVERVLVYNLKENGFVVEPGALFDSCWESCIAHGMQSSGGDGFAFLHVLPSANPSAHPNRVFPDGIQYDITLRRCLALRNRLDGFDIGQGVGGVTLELCLGDGNAWGEWHSKDLKVWSGSNRLIQSRMTGRTLFVNGTTEMRDFKAGTSDVRVGYGTASGKPFATPLRESGSPEGDSAS